MADLKIAKTAIRSGIKAVSPGETGKLQPSAFDQVRSKIAERVAADLKLPALAQPNPQQAASLANSLNLQLQRTDARNASEFFRVEMKDKQASLDKLTNAVSKLPEQNTFAPIRQRLDTIEQQFQRSGDLIRSVKDMDPKSLLDAQMQLYQLSENIEMLSKVVDHVSSGVKTVMQTQV
jgi:hypothetical protein